MVFSFDVHRSFALAHAVAHIAVSAVISAAVVGLPHAASAERAHYRRWRVQFSNSDSRLHPSAVYDGDHRVDISEVTDPKILRNADATVSVFDRKNLTPGAGGFDISKTPMKDSMHICSDEKFAEQPTAADCSGVLVGPKLIFTAGHCITRASCSQTAFVFGYRLSNAGAPETHFPNHHVFSCHRILARSNTESVDYAVVELDREVKGRTPVSLAADDVEDGESVYLLSHPAGTPLKYSAPVRVTNVSKRHFVAPIDALGGSSGGPVFSQARNELVGILVSGEDDYVEDKAKACRRVNNIRLCGEGNECDGEQSTHVSAIVDALSGRALRTSSTISGDRSRTRR